MRIVPAHKQDFDACAALDGASDVEVVSNIRELLVWLQDMNWPVASRVERRVKDAGPALVAPIKEILAGADDVWKYWVVSSLLPKVGHPILEALRPDLERIVSSPSKGEVEEEVVDAVRSLFRHQSV